MWDRDLVKNGVEPVIPQKKLGRAKITNLNNALFGTNKTDLQKAKVRKFVVTITSAAGLYA